MLAYARNRTDNDVKDDSGNPDSLQTLGFCDSEVLE